MKAALAAVLAVAVIEELIHARRHLGQATASWWEDVEHHDRVELEKAEMGFLVRRLAKR